MKKVILLNGEKVEVHLSDLTGHSVSFVYKGKEYSFEKVASDATSYCLKNGSLNHKVLFDGKNILVGGMDLSVENPRTSRTKGKSEVDAGMSAPMPGKILKVLVAPGQSVQKGESLLVMEAMKMEHAIKASYDGVLKKVYFSEGQLVEAGAALVDLEKSAES